MQTNLTDFDSTEIRTDGGADLAVRTDDGSATVTDDWVGEFVYASWGYGQTNVEIAQITEVSDTGKTVKAVMVAPEVAERSRGSESLAPTDQRIGEEFRLQVREGYKGEASFRGSYPHVDGNPENGTRLDSFGRLDEDSTVHQTPHGHRH